MNCPLCGSPSELLAALNPSVIMRCGRGHTYRVEPELEVGE